MSPRFSLPPIAHFVASFPRDKRLCNTQSYIQSPCYLLLISLNVWMLM